MTQIHSICACGSSGGVDEIKGSDYDMVIVTKDLMEKAPIRSDEASRKSSTIIVDKETLLSEARRPTPGELIIGRFLNVYEPLVNAEFLHEVEIEYKKWIIAEELMEIQSDYNDFSSNLILPYEYFLFDKLHKKALEYPEAIESYANTYRGAQKSENLEFAIRGFREAAELLTSRGIMEKNDDSVRIFRGRKERKAALSTLYKMYPLTTRGAIKYAFHSFASGLGVEFKTKPLPKLKVIGKVESTIELDRPNKLL